MFLIMSNRKETERPVPKAPQADVPSPASDRSETESSKAPSLTDTAKPQIDFQFLNFSHPSDAKRSKTRRAVRSHVTRQQHQKEHAAALARRAKKVQTPASTERSKSTASLAADAECLTLNTSTGAGPSNSYFASETSSTSPSPSGSPKLEQRINPAELYPDAWHSYIPQVMDYYMTNMAVEIPDVDETTIKQLLRATFFPFVLTDPALLHAVMLVAAAYYRSVHGLRSHDIDLFHLRGMTIREINRALEDPARATSDQVVVAVAKMATYEALYGDKAIFNTHMTGLIRMISLRGGLPSLGLDGLLVRIILWIDVNTTHLAGVTCYFDPAAFTSPYSHPKATPEQFPGPLSLE
ncbi:Hypothetical protein R9X50_00668900 [Acrodontium crateriforme]|uniref:Transcription factor domain-containing protein n=1 Tax=Acrodontium crateriforme TaxID=150365 RepID=A0AAQ3MC26_9PEZI|nr:Hypothetical protein R9X50_00668900 [Acrodontium crateriforme]